MNSVVGKLVCDSMIKEGKGPTEFLAFGEIVKKFLGSRTPTGAAETQLNEAADRFFSAIASDVGSQDKQ